MAEKGEGRKLPFAISRLASFFRLLLRSRMATIGLAIIILYIAVSSAAPLLTPFDPDKDFVSGKYARPEWIMSFSDGYYMSRNIVPISDPGLNAPSSLQEWTFTTDASAGDMSLSYNPEIGVSAGERPASGSAEITYSGTSPAQFVLARTFNYPYHGPPSAFEAFVSLRAQGASRSNPIQVALFIDRVDDKAFTIWQGNITRSNSWVFPDYILDSESATFAERAGFFGLQIDAASIIFSSLQDYSYGLEINFNGPGTVNVDNVDLKLLGTAYGFLGADYLGRDLFTQLIYGARVSLLVGLLSAFVGIGLGLVVGLLAGYAGKLVDEVLMRFTDMMLVIPGLPLLLVLIAVLGASLTNIIIVIGFLGWMGFARVIRSQVLTLKERPFIEAAKAAGAGTMRITTKHIIPNIVSLTYVNLALTVPAAILAESALSFLGLGDPTVISWGRMFFNAQFANALDQWWWVVPPGIAIAVISLSFVLIGYALDEIFNPKLRKRR